MGCDDPSRVGHKTYAFRQVIPEAVVGDVPGSATVGDVTAAIERLVWVRPEIGAIVREDIHVVKTQRTDDAVLILLDANFRDTASDVARASKSVDDALAQSRWLLAVVPAILAALGMVALFASVSKGITTRSRAHTKSSREQR